MNKNSQLYFLGGGTCCGKSTLAKLFEERLGFRIYAVDEDLQGFINLLAEAGNALAQAELAHSMEEMWMRNPLEMLQEEILLYEAMFPLVLEKIASLPRDTPILAEGAAFMPHLIHAHGVDASHYVCLTPTRAFQVKEYSKRPWIEYYLADTSDPDLAFSNWMARDVLFSKQMQRDAHAFGYRHILVDGTASVEDVYGQVQATLGLPNTQHP